jgi:GTP-binding protein
MADIPGLIEGASEGAGLGHDFLRHIERCRLIVQVIDISGVEGRDPVDDFHTISEELEKFSQLLADKPRILVANKCDLLLEGEESEEAKRLKTVADAMGYPLYFISAATKMNLKELIDAITQELSELPPVITFDAEAPLEEPETEAVTPEAVTVHRDDSGAFVCEGKWLQKLVDRTNLDDRESLMYFQRMLQSCGIIDKLREAGCDEGHTVKMFGIEFDFVN